MDKLVKREEWYQTLIDECKSIITEAIFNSRWALVEGYHNLGKRIREDSSRLSTTLLLNMCAVDLKTSERTLWYAVQFYDKYPDLSHVPEGKNITWSKLKMKYLPAHKITKSIPMLAGVYRIIYADPPWKYGDKPPAPNGSGAMEYHYNSMSIEELCSMRLPKIAQDAVLFLWVTSPLLEECFEVIKAWGFKYKASFIWDKVSHNVGHYNSVRHELLLICIKGSCPPDNKVYYDSVVSIKRSRIHSEKPERFREIIDELYPNGNRIELFARKKVLGWESWGLEVKDE